MVKPMETYSSYTPPSASESTLSSARHLGRTELPSTVSCNRASHTTTVSNSDRKTTTHQVLQVLQVLQVSDPSPSLDPYIALQFVAVYPSTHIYDLNAQNTHTYHKKEKKLYLDCCYTLLAMTA